MNGKTEIISARELIVILMTGLHEAKALAIEIDFEEGYIIIPNYRLN